MNFLEHHDFMPAGYGAVAPDRAAADSFSIQSPGVADALPVKEIMDRNAPDSLYAAYYYAMNFLFVPDTSFIARDGQGRVVGGFVGLYDFELKKLAVSHIAASLSLEAEQAAAVKEQLVQRAFENAANRGVEEISARLDTPYDPAIERAVTASSHRYNLRSHLAFNDAAPESLDAARPDPAGIDAGAIVYRHPVETDSLALWSLVRQINKQSGGLDIYALSNYQRLCRDLPQTCMVAEHQGDIVGFATGFIMPGDDGKGLFLWQTGVHPDYHGKGIGSKVETLLIDLHRPDYLNFTVEASNGAANRTAEKKADYMRAGFAKTGAIATEHLGGGHEPEVIYHVGPTIKPLDPA